MANQTLGLSPQFYHYYQSICLRETEILKSLREATAHHPCARMQIAPEQGQLLAFLVKLMGAKKTLEVGVFTGYSSLAVALALPEDGQLIACDINEEYTKIAQSYWEKAGVAQKIQLYLGAAQTTLGQLLERGEANTFDLAFIDADKSNYETYYEMALQLVRVGGIVVIDNVFWGEKVADVSLKDNRTQTLRRLNEKLQQDARIFLSIIPIADGLSLALKL